MFKIVCLYRFYYSQQILFWVLGKFLSLQKKGKSENQQWGLVSIDAWAHLFFTVPNVVIYDGDVIVGN